MKYKILYLVMALILLVSMGLALIPAPAQAAISPALYVAIAGYGEDALVIYDVTDPYNPAPVGTSGAILDLPWDVWVEDSYAYVSSCGDDTIYIFDISDPTSLTPCGNWSSGGVWDLDCPKGIQVVDDYLYVVSFYNSVLVVLDISNPCSPTVVGGLASDETTWLYGPEDIMVVGNYAHIASRWGDSYTIVDISSPASPVYKGELEGNGAPYYINNPEGIYVDGTLTYIAGSADYALVIADNTNPASPSHVATIRNTGLECNEPPWLCGGKQIVVSDSHAFVSTLYDLSVIDVSTPASPSSAGHINGSGAPNYIDVGYGLAVQNDIAYMTSHDANSLSILDVSDPTNPSLLSAVSGSGSPYYLGSPSRLQLYNFLPSPEAPTNLLATPLSSTEISLTWTLGEYSDYTGLYFKVGSYPSNRADGTRLYLGSMTSYSHQGLEPGTTYYYRAWGYNSATEVWSDSYDQDMATTLLGTGGGPPGPDVPPEWSQDPTCAVYENTPICDVLIWAAESVEVPNGTACFGFTMLLIVMTGVTGYLVTKRSEEVLLAVIAVGITVASIAGALPMWMIVFAILLGGGTWFLWKRV